MIETALPTPFNPNTDGEGLVAKAAAQMPVYPHATTVEGYVAHFMREVDNVASMSGMIDTLAKAIRRAPETLPFARIAALPDPMHKGLLEPPGMPPMAIQRLVREHHGPKVIIGMRCADVARYSVLSKHPWKPGWGVTLREGLAKPSKKDRADIQNAETFLQNCNLETGDDINRRGGLGYTSFGTFLSALTRDSLQYDGMAVWTDSDADGRVQAFKAVSAANIRLTYEGFEGRKDVFAVMVDEANNVRERFTRRQLAWAVRNPRTDNDVQGYGWSEVDMALTLITGFTNAIELNLDTFNKNSVPNGILLAKGNWLHKQLDVLSRIWGNLKRGTSKTWAMPAISVPKDGDLTLLDLTRLKGNDVYYRDLMNMLVGLLCTLWNFPVTRLGYKVSGTGSDSTPNPGTSGGVIVDDDDPGLAPLLISIESLINEHLIWPRWPTLCFRFFGKNPKEDAREYEARMNAMTFAERRALSDLPPLSDIAPAKLKEVAELMDMCPTDPGLVAPFQAMAAALLSADTKADTGEGEKGSPFPAKKDPAASEAHGHTSGVRRDSASEAKSTD